LTRRKLVKSMRFKWSATISKISSGKASMPKNEEPHENDFELLVT
jgi:hypothetical protein